MRSSALCVQLKMCHPNIAPPIKLYINDHSMEEAKAKSDALLVLVERLLHKGMIIHEIGFQCHLSLRNTLICSVRLPFRRTINHLLDDVQAIWSKTGRNLQI